MKERPIIFNGEMVRAILDGRKTQTRRVVKPQPVPATTHPDCSPWVGKLTERDFSIIWCTTKGDGGIYKDRDEKSTFRCPYGQPGDLLWVRETFCVLKAGYNDGREKEIVYKADNHEPVYIWRPSIHMPRWASRIILEITDVRVERVQDISEADARAEGVFGDECLRYDTPFCADQALPSMCFANLWDSINAKRGYGWEQNPWVWVVEFRRIDP